MNGAWKILHDVHMFVGNAYLHTLEEFEMDLICIRQRQVLIEILLERAFPEKSQEI